MIVFFSVLVFLEISNPQDGINICGERKGEKRNYVWTVIYISKPKL